MSEDEVNENNKRPLSWHGSEEEDDDEICGVFTEPELQHRYKRTCVRMKSEEPDVTVIVGGREFQEYRQILGCVSGYFDAAFHSGMKEAQSKTFEFPERDPAEWEMLMSVITPGSAVWVTDENVLMILEWCDLLCIEALKPQCDEALTASIAKDVQSYRETKKKAKSVPKLMKMARLVTSFVDALRTALAYNLDKSKADAFQAVFTALDMAVYYPRSFQVETTTQILTLVKDYKECADKLWEKCRTLLPEDVRAMDKEALLDNALLPHIMWLQMKKGNLKKTVKRYTREGLALPAKLKSKLDTGGALPISFTSGEEGLSLATTVDCETKLQRIMASKGSVWQAHAPPEWRTNNNNVNANINNNINNNVNANINANNNNINNA